MSGEIDVDQADVWIWFAVPESGIEHLLMVHTAAAVDGAPPMLRPLMALDETTALSYTELAQEGARALDSVPVLRRFTCVAVVHDERPEATS